MKQFLLVCNDDGIEALQRVFNNLSIQFIEISGMKVEGRDYQVLVSSNTLSQDVPEIEPGTECNVPE